MGISYSNFMARIHNKTYAINPSTKAKKEYPSEEDISKWEEMDKLELDEYAHNHDGIELDRRQTKSNMVKEFLTKLKGE